MSTSEEILTKLLASPDAELIIKKYQEKVREEFARRKEFYDLVHEDTKAEFINGEIIFHSPVKGSHWKVTTKLASRLSVIVEDNNLGVVGVEKVMIRCTRNDYEPDVVFFDAKLSADFKPDQLLFPPPTIAVEVLSHSTRQRDYGIKFNDYAAHGIAEYWIIDPDELFIEQYTNQNGEYQLHQKLVAEGTLKTPLIPGFKLDVGGLFS